MVKIGRIDPSATSYQSNKAYLANRTNTVASPSHVHEVKAGPSQGNRIDHKAVEELDTAEHGGEHHQVNLARARFGGVSLLIDLPG